MCVGGVQQIQGKHPSYSHRIRCKRLHDDPPKCFYLCHVFFCFFFFHVHSSSSSKVVSFHWLIFFLYVWVHKRENCSYQNREGATVMIHLFSVSRSEEEVNILRIKSKSYTGCAEKTEPDTWRAVVRSTDGRRPGTHDVTDRPCVLLTPGDHRVNCVFRAAELIDYFVGEVSVGSTKENVKHETKTQHSNTE